MARIFGVIRSRTQGTIIERVCSTGILAYRMIGLSLSVHDRPELLWVYLMNCSQSLRRMRHCRPNLCATSSSLAMKRRIVMVLTWIDSAHCLMSSHSSALCTPAPFAVFSRVVTAHRIAHSEHRALHISHCKVSKFAHLKHIEHVCMSEGHRYTSLKNE